MSRLAIIVPYLGNAPWLESTLASVLANRPDDCEVLVVLQRPYDDPYAIQGEVRFVPGDRRGVAEAVNLGIREADAPVVHVLLCGTEVREGWADAAVARLRDPRIAAVAPLVLDADDPERIVAAGLAYDVGGAIVALSAGRPADSLGSNPKRVLTPHPAAAFYRKSAVEALGPFDSAVGDWLTGLDAGLTLRQLGWITVLEPGCRVTVPRRDLLPAGAFRRAFEAERLFWRWAPMLGRVRSVASHGLLVVAEGVRGLLNLSIVPRWAGRLTGGCAAVVAPGYGRRFAELRQTSHAEPAPPCPVAVPYPMQAAGRDRIEGRCRKRAG